MSGSSSLEVGKGGRRNGPYLQGILSEGRRQPCPQEFLAFEKPEVGSEGHLIAEKFYFWRDHRLDLQGRSGSWHGGLGQGLMATLQEHGIGMEA